MNLRLLLRLSVLLVLLVPCLTLLAWPAPARASAGWTWPLPGQPEVVTGFDPPAQPWLAGHRGVDLAGRAGEPVRAAGAGVVAFAGRVGGMPVVSVRHPDGLLTTYQPVRASVRAGQPVGRGDRIGRLVAAGSHCPPRVCLHWGLRRDRDYLDPLLLVRPGRVRLLPLYADGGTGPPPGWAVPVTGGAGLASATLALGWLRLRRRRPQLSGPARPDAA